MIATGSFVWQCIVTREEVRKEFTRNGATYLFLDVTNRLPFIIKVQYIGILTDMFESFSIFGPILCTWRDQRNSSLLALFMNVWREEEERIGVKKAINGCISGA